MSDKSTLHAAETTCARCGRIVGILWFRGDSTLFDGPLDTDGRGNLVVTRHQCPEPTDQPRSQRP
jgi:hypothetical protein